MRKLFVLVLALVLVFFGLHLYGSQTSDFKGDILVFGYPPQADGLPSPTLEARLDRAASYLESQPQARALLLGGGGEAQAMATYLKARGLDPQRLYLEDQSTNTWTNLKQAKLLMDQLDIDQVLVSSSDYHIFRIKFLARRLDLEVYPLGARTPLGDIIPSYSRELLAIVKSFLFDH